MNIKERTEVKVVGYTVESTVEELKAIKQLVGATSPCQRKTEFGLTVEQSELCSKIYCELRDTLGV